MNAIARKVSGIHVGRVLEDALATLGEWRERARQRRQLSELDDRMLKDIGIPRSFAEREARKPFWLR